MTQAKVVLLFSAAAIALLPPAPAYAQRSRSAAVGRAVPRGTAVPRTVGGPPRGVAIARPPVLASRPLHYPYYPYYPRYRFGFSYGYPWGYAPFGFGFSYGYPGPYYGPGFGVGFSYGYPGYGYGYGYAPHWYGFGYPVYGYPAAPAYVVPVPGVGYGGVRLDLSQRNAEVWVDGYLVGTVNDFDGTFQQIKLEPGAHRIEIRAPGYETTSFDVKIDAGRTITYRTDLRPIQ